jgi:hypothetical protein
MAEIEEAEQDQGVHQGENLQGEGKSPPDSR